MASLEANGITIEYEVHGTGDPILLVMGLAGQLVDWTPEFIGGLVERGHQVITFDNRDSGLSTEFDWTPPSHREGIRNHVLRREPDAGYLVDDMADDAAALLEELSVESAHILGISMGGMISQALAIKHPGRVRSLTSIMSNTGDRKHGRVSMRLVAKALRLGRPTAETAVEYNTQVFQLISGPHFDLEGFRARAQASFERSYRPLGASRQTAAIAASPDRTEALGRVTAPTLVIHGLQDPLVKPSGGIATARAIPESRLLMLPDMGHAIPEPRRNEILDAVAVNAARARVPLPV